MDASLKRDDILVVLKLAADGRWASVRELERSLGISKSAVAQSIERLAACDLVRGEGRHRRVDRLALRDFIVHGLRWVAPAKRGPFVLGLPTAHAASPLAEKLRGDPDPVVMPLAEGPMRGRAVPPIHDRAPLAARDDAKLHRLLAIADAFRIGTARDREAARSALSECLDITLPEGFDVPGS